MKNYSFSNIAAEEALTRNSTDLSAYYRHSELKAQQANQRIQEIKKKYDTPSRRQRIDSLKKSQDLQIRPSNALQGQENVLPRERPSEDEYYHRPAPTFGTDPLKESFAVNRLEKSTLRNDEDCRQLQNMRKGYGGEDRNFSSYCRQDEQMLFSKMREMKESLVSKEFMRGSMHPRSSISSKDERRCLDPRVENIDKINSKIKQILSCLSENQKQPTKYLKESNREANEISQTSFDYIKKSYFKEESVRKEEPARKSTAIEMEPRGSFHSHKPTTIAPTHHLSYCDTNKQTSFRQEQKAPDVNTMPHPERGARKELTLRESYSVQKLQHDFSRTPYHLNKHQEAKTPLQASRSRSQMASVHSLKDDTLKSGKKLNEEISKIQSRIEAMEREKKMLNIEFTPFSTKNRSTSALLTGTHIQPASIDRHRQQTEKSSLKPLIPHFRSSSTTKDQTFSSQLTNYRFSEQKDTRVEEQWSKSKASREKQSQDGGHPRRSLSLQQVEVDIKTVRIDKEEEQSIEQSRSSQIFQQSRENYEQVRKRTDEGMLERQKRLQYPHDELIKSDSLKKLVSLFCEQAKLDEKFRNMKIWLEELTDQDKLHKLSIALKEKSLVLSTQEFQTAFKVDESEHNPFFSLQGFQGSFEAVVAAYTESTSHWESKVKGQFERGSLLGGGFTQGKMDLERKGFVELEDLVRLLNIQSGTFYRNRDIFLIFKRLTGKDRASFEEILNELCP